MKLRNLIITIVLAGILAYVVPQILWMTYELAGLYSSIAISTYDNLVFFSTLGLFTVPFLVLWRKMKREKPKKHGIRTHDKKLESALDKDFTVQDLALTVMPSRKEALLEFIIIGDGKNLHQTLPFKKDAEYKSEANPEVIYKVYEENLLLRKPFWRRKKLVAVFHSDGAPVKIESSDAKVTAEILHLAAYSTALSRTIKEMFATHIGMKKVLFFVVIGIVGVVVFMILSGGIRF